jgi:hypothetical protein
MNVKQIRQVVEAVQAACSPDLLKPEYRRAVQNGAHPLTGHCYAASEAVYHLLGGKAAGLTPMVMAAPKPDGTRGTHWYLRCDDKRLAATSTRYIDPTWSQFGVPPMWTEGRGAGFLTRQPSKRAKTLIEKALLSLPQEVSSNLV